MKWWYSVAVAILGVAPLAGAQTYVSAFADYKPYAAPAVADWKKTNAAVAAAANPHAGHGVSKSAVETADPHAGHDMSQSGAKAADPHAGHDMSKSDVKAADPHAGNDMTSRTPAKTNTRAGNQPKKPSTRTEAHAEHHH